MKNSIYKNNKRKVSLLLFLLILINFKITAQTKQNSKPEIFHIQNYFSEAYLIKGNSEKLLLIETGVPVPGYQDSLVNSIKKLGFKPENITLAIVTHGHGDHAGNARFLQQTFKIKIAGSKADLNKFTSGKTELSKSEDVSIWGNRLRPYSDLSYQPFTPDIIVENANIDLEKYGVSGKIIPIKGGHTPGDLLILIGDNLFVGDAFVGTFKSQGGGLVPDGHHVREHFFHENKKLADENLKLIEKIAIENKVKTIYPTHNGPVSTYELTKYIKEEPLLKLFSKQEANPAAEDFRIVFSNENTAVLTFLETNKAEGKDAKTISVTETYSKEKGIWKVVYKDVK
ncbi:glyoxylase-like metal-dependent hydrolase (beta-lactamase superfamily II) [Flavobacterium chryseum]|uniref:MBL fold metallo-hydrolase n=1 Tax=Flavobacterium sp. P3160 TaxID=2512113 RepID=UPI00105F4A86|nr:MBL fold metallo-hydrolase [Flavobacterium sp. P3160]TDO83122.1 glyoxylase-like metal-dependent hydrolase (beta-lactamase superfamily II) [Flavobacterium sp. P3160]